MREVLGSRAGKARWHAVTPPMHEPVVVTDGGPWAEHDMACPVCTERKAILIIETGVFVPCHVCLRDGWELVRWLTPWGRLRARQRR